MGKAVDRRGVACTAALMVMLTACGGGGNGDSSGDVTATRPLAADPQTIRVVDGDTIDVNGQRYRLAGFDAPERDQNCLDGSGQEWACGQAATEELERLASAGVVSCAGSGQDRYGRTVGSCSTGGEAFGAVLVKAGLAVNDPRYSPSYAIEELEARQDGRGMHSGRYLAPWDWRSGERLDDASPGFLLTDSTEIDNEKLLPSEQHSGAIGPTALDIDPNAAVYGAWIGRSAFSVLVGDGVALGVSWTPHFPASNPKEIDGGASWSGLMVGTDTRNADILTGLVVIDLKNFSDPTADVWFTRIRATGSDASLGDIGWEGLPVRNGAFAASEVGGKQIEGRFYGDRHQEAGGVFEHQAIVGAFGASRDLR